MSLRPPQEFIANGDCIPEERESNPSPGQLNSAAFYGRESLAERPEEEGPIQSVDNMVFGTPFSAQSGQSLRRRQIPISNCCGVTADANISSLNTAQPRLIDQTGHDFAQNVQGLHVRQINSQT